MSFVFGIQTFATTYTNSTGYTSSTTYSEKRYIPIAPQCCEVIRRISPQDSEKIIFHGLKHNRLVENGQEIKYKKGLTRKYTEENTILNYKCLVRYSFSEGTGDYKDATVSNYLKELTVDKRNSRGEVEGQTLVGEYEDGSTFGSGAGLTAFVLGTTFAGTGLLVGTILLIVL